MEHSILEPSAFNMTLVENISRDRFELWIDGTIIGLIAFDRDPELGVYSLLHTVIEPDFGERGMARLLVTMVFARLRWDGHRANPVCTYIRGFIERFPEYRDVTDVEFVAI